GCFGLTSVALKTFMQDLKVDSNLLRAFKEAMFKPKARVKEGVALARCGAVTASIDSSDGLLESLQELAKVNNIGFIIEELPVCGDVKRFAEMFGYDLLDLVFRGGEEYELVLTLRPGYLDEALKAMRSVGGDLKIIGRVVKKQGVFFNEENGRVELKGDGYEHFKKRS
ncbi:MAG: AIR synthase-related protein, partial [Candidatus Odinarchaeota archaeon]